MQGLIAGYVDFAGGKPRGNLVAAMLDAMIEPGLANTRRIAECGPATFGAVTLAPASCPDPDPPYVDLHGGALTVADIRLYGADADNPREQLREALAKHDNAAIASLHCDLAAAHWDQSKGQLWLMRDHFGIRPLQYVVVPGRYAAFASLPWALLRTGLVERQLDDQGMRSFPVFGGIEAPNTCFASIKTVSAAHAVTVTQQQTKTRRVWRQNLPPLLPADGDPAAIASELRRLFEQAVHRRLPAEGAGAAHMSGGLDSTPIAVIASRALAKRGDRLHAYSVREIREPGLDPQDETPHVNETAASEPNLVLHGLHPIALDSILHATAGADTTQSFNPNVMEERFLRDAASRSVGHILSGWGGDECVTFRMVFRGEPELFWTGQWRALAKVLGTPAGQNSTRRTGFGLVRRFLSRVLIRSLPQRVRIALRTLLRTEPNDPREDGFSFVPAANRKDVKASRRPVYWNSQRLRRAALEYWWLESMLERYAQRGARHGVVYANPMLDRDLIDYAIRIPGALLYDGVRIRAIYRQAISDLVPDSVLFGDDKLVALPAEALRAARAKQWLIDEATRLSGLALVRRYVDMDALLARFKAIPDPEIVFDAINRDGADAENVLSKCLGGGYALQLAHFLAHHVELTTEAKAPDHPGTTLGQDPVT